MIICVNSKFKFKTLMLKSNLCDYSDAYILVKVKQQQLQEEEKTKQQENQMKDIKE